MNKVVRKEELYFYISYNFKLKYYVAFLKHITPFLNF